MRTRYITASIGAFLLALVLAIFPLMALASQATSTAVADFEVDVLEGDSPYALPKINDAAEDAPSAFSMASRAALPPTYDLRDSNDVTSVKDQNIFGTCWAFSAIAAFESALLTQGQAAASSLDLSEMQLAYFSDWTANAAQAEALGAARQTGEGMTLRDGALYTGGNAWTAAYIIARGTGVITEQQAPYANAARAIIHEVVDDWYGVPLESAEWDPAGSWTLDGNLATASTYQLHDMGFRTVSNRSMPSGAYEANPAYIDIMKQDLLDHGALAMSFRADLGTRSGATDEYTNVDTGGRFVDRRTNANHMATVVGWDDGFSASNFTRTPSGNGAWIVKNSYGSLQSPEGNVYPWGIDNTGYLYVSYYDASIEDYSWFTPVAPSQASKITLQHDLLGFASGSATELVNSEQVQQANIFTAPEDMILNAVSATAMKNDALVTTSVYLLDGTTSNPTAGSLATTQANQLDGEFYTQIELNEPVSMRAGQRFSIVQEIKAGPNWYVSVETGQANNSYNINGVNARAVLNPGESFIMQGGNWTEMSESKVANQVAATGLKAGNVMIKAFGDPQAFVEEVDPGKLVEGDPGTSGDGKGDGTNIGTGDGTATNHPLGVEGPDGPGGIGQGGNAPGAADEGGYSVDVDVDPGAQGGSLGSSATRNGGTLASDPKLAQTGDGTQIALILFSMTCALASVVLLGLGLRRSGAHR